MICASLLMAPSFAQDSPLSIPQASPLSVAQPFGGPLDRYLSPDYAGEASSLGSSPLYSGVWGQPSASAIPPGYLGLSPAASGFVSGSWTAPNPAASSMGATAWPTPAQGWNTAPSQSGWYPGVTPAPQFSQGLTYWTPPGLQTGPALSVSPLQPSGSLQGASPWVSMGAYGPAFQTYGTTSAGPWMQAAPTQAPAAAAFGAPQGVTWLTPPASTAPAQLGATWQAASPWAGSQWGQPMTYGMLTPQPWVPAGTQPLGAQSATQAGSRSYMPPGQAPNVVLTAPTWHPLAPSQLNTLAATQTQPFVAGIPGTVPGPGQVTNPWGLVVNPAASSSTAWWQSGTVLNPLAVSSRSMEALQGWAASAAAQGTAQPQVPGSAWQPAQSQGPAIPLGGQWIISRPQ